MTAVTQELTCPHERREIPDRDHNKRSFLAFFPFFHPHGTLANKQQSLILVTLYHAGIFHGSKRREMANDDFFYMCYTYFEEKYCCSIPTLDRTQRAWIFSIYAHCLFNGCCDST